MATIIVAEDDEHVRALLRVTLTEAGHRVIETRDGQEALEKLPGSGAEMLLLDLNMPRLDGLELCRKVRQSEEFKAIPILMLTVRELVDDQVRGYDAGADEYLTKPFEGPVLVARIRALLERTRK